MLKGRSQAAKEVGVSAEDAASAAADGALKAAGKVGSTAVETVRNAVTKTAHGAKVVLKQPKVAVRSNKLTLDHCSLVREVNGAPAGSEDKPN